jgi:MFS family permease
MSPFDGNCVFVPESPAREICVLAVVISGLSLITEFIPGRRKSPRNAITLFAMLLSVLSLFVGGLFYAFIVGRQMIEAREWWTYLVLGVALISSLVLAMQEALSKHEQTL